MSRFGFGFGFGASFGSGGGGIPLITQRNFTTTDRTFGMYYTIPIYTMAVGDTVEFKYLAPLGTTSGTEALIGGDVTGGNFARFHLLGNGAFGEAGFSNTLIIDGVSTPRTDPYPVDGKIHTIELTSDSTTAIAAFTGRQDGLFTYTGIMYDIVIKNSGGTIQRDYRVDETWIGPSTVLVDSSVNAQNGSVINIDIDDSEPFTFDGDVSPNTWTNDGATRILEIAGT